MNKALSFLILLPLVFAAASCGSVGPEDFGHPGTTNVTLRFDNRSGQDNTLSRSAVQSLPEDVHRIVLSISGPGMVPIEQELEPQPEAEFIELEIQVPNGPARIFRVDAFNFQIPSRLVYTGSATTALDGTPLELAIQMHRVYSPPLFAGLETAVASGSTTVDLGWSAASDTVTPPEEIQYMVFMAETSGCQDFGNPSLSVTGVQSATVPFLQPDTTYYFVVRARNETGQTDDNTVEHSATTEEEPDTDPPEFDGLQSAAATGTSTVELGWNAAADDVTPPEEIQYLVFMAETPGGENFIDPALVVTGDLTAEVPDLLPGTTYYFVVRARDQAGNTETNTVERSATTEQEQDNDPPEFNGLQSASATGATTVELNWAEATDNVTPSADIVYLVFLSETSGGEDFNNPSLTVTGDLTTVAQNLQPETTYYFVVRARDQAGNTETNTVERSTTTEQEQDTEPPNFTGLQSAITTGTTTVELSWSQATDNTTPSADIVYLVFISDASGAEDFNDPKFVVTGDLMMVVPNLQPETTYYFVVRARDQAGNTETNTVERFATTDNPDSTPPVFDGLQTATATGPNTVDLAWEEATDNMSPPSAIWYLVFLSDTPGTMDFNNPAKVVVGTSATEMSVLDPDHTYYFAVRARDEAGNTEENTVVESATTYPEPDNDPPVFAGLETAESGGSTEIALAWLQATDNVTPPGDIRYLVYAAETPGGQNFATPAKVVTERKSTRLNSSPQIRA